MCRRNMCFFFLFYEKRNDNVVMATGSTITKSIHSTLQETLCLPVCFFAEKKKRSQFVATLLALFFEVSKMKTMYTHVRETVKCGDGMKEFIAHLTSFLQWLIYIHPQSLHHHRHPIGHFPFYIYRGKKKKKSFKEEEEEELIAFFLAKCPPPPSLV